MAAGIDIQWERKNGALVAATSLILVSGLLVLAGIFSNVRPAFAQTQIECPLPAGVTPPADPRVTAKQVEDGRATLMDFALAVRERSREHSQQATTVEQGQSTTVEQGQYIGCIIRQEGSPWRSGSTYIVTLTTDGRVYIHAKDMALSGRLLNPLIYAEILSALGVSPTDLANLASPDPGTAGPALQAVLAALSQEPDGAFDATASIPGASGHAAVYVSSELGAAPIVLLAGFDLNESHLVSIDDETIDYGDPAVTARDVVDRETLKAFVTQAGEFFLEIMSTGNVAAASKARIAFRDPNGPWRHGSVYIAVLQPATNLILFHGAFPDRFELRQAGISRDAVTGELIVDQLTAAANSGPEGGFWEYHFDDPADDSDSADIPKVGYARVFSGQLPGPGGTTIPTDFIINSGFYVSPAGTGELRGVLENPGPDSFQSGVSALWGWVCDAAMVEIEIETAQGEVEPYRAMYGMERLDTQAICGDTNNGFVLLFNWNRLGAGDHMVTALVDGLELGRAMVRVTTVGEGDQEEFLRGAMGECVAEDFPQLGQSALLEWQQNSQNFVITDVQ